MEAIVLKLSNVYLRAVPDEKETRFKVDSDSSRVQ